MEWIVTVIVHFEIEKKKKEKETKLLSLLATTSKSLSRDSCTIRYVYSFRIPLLLLVFS